MKRILPPISCLCFILWVPLMASGRADQLGRSDCKSMISHSGFAEFVLPNDGGKHKLPIKVGPSVKWTVRNRDYVEWIEILDGESGTGQGDMTIQLEPNTGRFCRVGILTISGLAPIYGSPIRILQRGVEAAGRDEEAEPSVPWQVNLGAFPGSNPQSQGKAEYKKATPRR